MEKNKKISVGFDLDGVIASPLFDGLLIKIRILKEHFLKSLVHQRDYFYPRTKIERGAWRFLNRLRRPTVDPNVLEEFKSVGNSIYLITSRFKFLEKDTLQWLKKNGFDKVFNAIYINNFDLDPIDFKTSILNQNSIGYYVDDDLEVLEALKDRVGAKLYWLGASQASFSHKLNTVPSISDFISLLSNVKIG